MLVWIHGWIQQSMDTCNFLVRYCSILKWNMKIITLTSCLFFVIDQVVFLRVFVLNLIIVILHLLSKNFSWMGLPDEEFVGNFFSSNKFKDANTHKSESESKTFRCVMILYNSVSYRFYDKWILEFLISLKFLLTKRLPIANLFDRLDETVEKRFSETHLILKTKNLFRNKITAACWHRRN